MQRRDTSRGRELGRRRMQDDARGATRCTRYFDRAPGSSPYPHAKRFQHRFLRGEARGQSFGTILRVSALAFGEEAIDDSRVTLQRSRKARDVNEVDANAASRHYSTVTVLARLRGRSTLRPRPRAIVYAKSCSGTTSTMGLKSGSVAGTRNT